MKRLEEILKKQVAFQKLVGFPIDTNVESVRNELAEKYLFKMIEEAVELRREFPSVMNPWSKHQKAADLTRIKEEFSDVVLFLMNFMLTFKMDPTEVLEQLEATQANNFKKIKARTMDGLNQDILKVQNHVSGVGQGNLSPKVVIIGQNPSNTITKGYKFWSDPAEGSSKILLPSLEKAGIKLEDCYFTNIVKSTTIDNLTPDESLTSFWKEFLKRELEILGVDNPEMKIVTLGNWSDENLQEYPHIKAYHPAYVLRGGMKREDYDKHIQEAIAHTD